MSRSSGSNPQAPSRAELHRIAPRGLIVGAVGPAALFFTLVATVLAPVSALAVSTHGLPFTHVYSMEVIGFGTHGARLGFDRFGRVAVIHGGIYTVLNDTTWVNIADTKGPDGVQMANVVQAPDGHSYYGALASWGRATIGTDGLLHSRSLVPADAPDWIHLAPFAELIATSSGVYFISPSGVAYWDFKREETQLYQHYKISRAFCVGDRVYLSAFEQPLAYIDTEAHRLVRAPATELDENVVEFSTDLDDHRALLSLLDGRLLVYDGQQVTPWVVQPANIISGHLSALERLADGKIAAAILGKGLLLFTPDGQLLRSLDTPPNDGITSVASREPGVLWAATDDGIEKILYNSPLTSFGQKLGLPASWPIIQYWQGRIYVESNGSLYRAHAGSPGAPARFELCPDQPGRELWTLSACGPRMLVGGSEEVFDYAPDGRLHSVAKVHDIAHLVMFDPEHCYVIGRSESALLVWRDGKWVESGPRTRGVTYPSAVHQVRQSAWLELGGEVGRLWIKDGRLRFDVIPNSPWTTAPWVNIGSIKNVVVLSGNPGQRRFFDEEAGAWTDAPHLRSLLNRSPIWIRHVQDDATGTIWATHDDGIIRITPNGSDYDIDAHTFDFISDRFPVVHVLPDNDIWVTATQSLYHVEMPAATRHWTVSKPVLVSLVDAHDNRSLFAGDFRTGESLRLTFEQNNPIFHFYSGSDAWQRAPIYEYKLTSDEPWTTLAGSQLAFRDLPEGEYNLQVRIREEHGSSGPVFKFPFDIFPPWYRTWPAYGLYGMMGILAIFGLVRRSIYLERKQNRMLERVVHERTRQLEDTMAKLGEETRNAATLAERDRLANEIHDSVQQGLTGAMLQLDSTLKLPTVDDNLRTRLDVVRNMVSYARQEVQNAVWDMESPLLEGTELADALRNLTNFADSGDAKVEVVVTGQPTPLSRATSHHLLRIAQEAVTNAFRHAQARRIAIKLAYDVEALTLEITDDGQGFSLERVFQEKVGHLGLRGIRTRVKKLGGRLDIESSVEHGTSIRVTMPVESQAESHDNAEA